MTLSSRQKHFSNKTGKQKLRKKWRGNGQYRTSASAVLENEQLDLRRCKLEHQINRDKAEEERRETAVTKDKSFGDAMRASIIRMDSDPIEAIPFSRNIEQLFSVDGVPNWLQSILICPFLNDKAEIILRKLSPEVVEHLKVALLQEFKLSASVYT